MKFSRIILSPNNLVSFAKQQRYRFKYRKVRLKVGMNCEIINPVFGMHNFIGDQVLFENSALGDHSYINSRSFVSNATIGRYTSIAHDVQIGLGAHPISMVSTHGAFYSNNKGFETYADHEYFKEFAPITIGNDVWIGARAMLLDGISIGDGAVIAAGAVVTRNVEPYAVVGGVPAKLIKYRFDKEIIEKLLGIKWWDLDEEWLRKNFLLFHDVITLINFFESHPETFRKRNNK